MDDKLILKNLTFDVNKVSIADLFNDCLPILTLSWTATLGVTVFPEAEVLILRI